MIAAVCLALNVYFEARSEPIIGQLGVAQVTMNRVASSKYPDTVCEVVWQAKQFSWTHDGKSDRPMEDAAWRTAQWVARLTLNDTEGKLSVLPDDVLHYHADYVEPFWIAYCDRVTKIGVHIFYRKKT